MFITLAIEKLKKNTHIFSIAPSAKWALYYMQPLYSVEEFIPQSKVIEEAKKKSIL